MNRNLGRKIEAEIFLPEIFLPASFPGSGAEIAAVGGPLVLSLGGGEGEANRFARQPAQKLRFTPGARGRPCSRA